MACKPHGKHTHAHGKECGHTRMRHDRHTDYLHDGHLHNVHGDHVDDHGIAAKIACTPKHACEGHEPSHKHGSKCGHEPIRHGDHMDYLVGDHVHHPHKDHCDVVKGLKRAKSK